MNCRPLTLRVALMLAVSTLAFSGTAFAQQNQMAARAQGGTTQQMPNGGQQQAGMQMEYRQVEGTIRDLRRVKLRGSDRRAVLALLETDGGNRIVVDLGTERLPVTLKRGQELSVRGRVISLGDRRVVLKTNAIRYDGRTLSPNRPATRQPASSRQADNQQRRNQGQNPGRQLATNLGPYDANNDALLSPQELTRALYTMFDRDGNGYLSIAEWDRGIDRTFGEGDVNLQVSVWDRNGNGRISRNEFRSALVRSGLYDRIDVDRSGGISREETQRFAGDTRGRTGMNRTAFRNRADQAGMFDQFDTDRSGRIGTQEYAAGVYSTLDANDDNRLSQREFDRSDGWFGDEEGLFQDWDDGDSWLSEDEFARGVANSGAFDDFDRDGDGWFDDDEFYDAAYNGWDRDGDGILDDQEWQEASSVYEDEGLF